MSRHQNRAKHAIAVKQSNELSKLYLSIVLMAEVTWPGRHAEVRVYNLSTTDRRVAVLLDPPTDANLPTEIPEGHEAKSNILEVQVTTTPLDATKVLLKKMQRLYEPFKSAKVA